MKHTKHALVASGLALVVSAALLVGTTFAWFTDSVVNTGNRIQSGNLAIGAYAYDLGQGGQQYTIPDFNEGAALTFEANPQNLKTDGAPIISDGNFEPGKSNAKLLAVCNEGSLAVKIKLDFSVTDGGLMQALWFDFVQVENGVVTGRFQQRPMSELSTMGQNLEIPLLPEEGQDSVSFILIYGMYEEAGNEYLNTSFSADVSILATQYAYEADGFDNPQYDAGAAYPTVANTSNYQTVLDSAADDTTVQLAGGSYGAIQLSQTRYSEAIDGNTSQLRRAIHNLTIEGDGNTTVDGVTIAAGHIYGTEGNPVTNPVTGETTESTVNSYYSYIEIDGLTFKNIRFTKAVSIGGWSGEQFIQVSNVTFENCTFEGAGPDNTSADNKLASFGADGTVYHNLTFKNCTVKNAYQGIYVVNADGVTVENCTFENLGHNAVAIQTARTQTTPDATTGGEIVIRNNTMTNIADRAIRFGHIGADANISITGNVMTAAGDTDGQLIKCDSAADGARIFIDDNYWSGRDVAAAIDGSMGITDENPRENP